MKSSPLFEKNLNALKMPLYVSLLSKLKRMKESKKFEPLLDLDPLNLNILEMKTKKKLYKNPLEELENFLAHINQNFITHPVLFFYGVGNGYLYKILLQNKNFKRIIVFEKELELLFLALNLADFTQELLSGRLVLLLSAEFSPSLSNVIFKSNELKLLLRSYYLHLHCDFYARYHKDILRINTINKNSIITSSLHQGNDPKDALQGIAQFTENLPKMLIRPSFDELLTKRKGKVQTAIIVSTGPSLTKQLPLLKKYSKKASIFCLDASYPILAKHKIKPDYVLSLERIRATSDFFDNDFGSFDDDILFILLTLTHPASLEFLERNKRKYMLVPRSLPFSVDVRPKGFGELSGMSVAHMSFQLAMYLEHKNIILIGQDLAFSQDGTSHSKGYSRGEEKSIQNLPRTKLKAYGGKGFVQTTEIWKLFKEIFDNLVQSAPKDIKIYNATEGGARIEGTIEKPFKELCQNLLTKEVKKPLTKLKAYPKRKQNELMLYSYKKIKTHIRQSETIIKECKKVGKQISTLTQANKQKYSLDTIFHSIDKLKDRLGTSKYNFLNEILGPSVFHNENSFAPLFLQNVENESEKQNKLVAWIYSSEALIDEIHNLVLLQNETLKKTIVPLRDLLEKRGVI
ncbi:DUF115 domain-containing protein [Campylobacter sp. MIT 21-1685]|uniref:motility associated factor glycosyltransferase family protein n=1 Tax=unclassified Campylobacter TaxID=2593542 RepID=UPI00224AEACF|nr:MULTISPECIES: 6-hydroxymethylpterin diphosphokinase MptE-like protein [unclassified Campylobacter]MCX2683732.1 DUF115 domain-containing protein [Campylobacter sp. MIT 21-1684]MCX2752003.1 DUF115 domain-containing protein [Campylobacter sp. MIT 21-1682]MCX2808213.1 DUF115 domain-containing protein [Campylobacter sp. MIT 21-1685]